MALPGVFSTDFIRATRKSTEIVARRLIPSLGQLDLRLFRLETRLEQLELLLGQQELRLFQAELRLRQPVLSPRQLLSRLFNWKL